MQAYECLPGTYSNQSQTKKDYCPTCPAGNYCPYSGMSTPIVCPMGTYREEIRAQVNCTLCPEGTWSNKTGLQSEEECEDCPAKYLCQKVGMTSLDEAEECPAGFVCHEGTNRFDLLKNLCPPGFWCKANTSEIADYEPCASGYFCPEGTSSQLQTSYPCTVEYFCPFATSGEQEGDYWTLLNREEYEEVILEKEEANRHYAEVHCEEDSVVSSECIVYNITQPKACETDAELPQDLLDSYDSLKCPDGTTS